MSAVQEAYLHRIYILHGLYMLCGSTGRLATMDTKPLPRRPLPMQIAAKAPRHASIRCMGC
jgi:hypothetical protein